MLPPLNAYPLAGHGFHVTSDPEEQDRESVASASFVLVKADRTRIKISVVVGKPYMVGECEARCPIRLEGLHAPVAEISGEGTLQALCLALDLAWRLVVAQLDQGHQLLDDAGEPEDSASIAATFGRTPTQPEGAG